MSYGIREEWWSRGRIRIAADFLGRRCAISACAQSVESKTARRNPIHFWQIWVPPEQAGLPPIYEQQAFPVDEKALAQKRVEQFVIHNALS